ncbi:MAG: magnesium-translocating P-type ATPase [Candidatus Altiarchaeota archaeon]
MFFDRAAKRKQEIDLIQTSSSPADLLLDKYETSIKGLSEKEAERRLEEYGSNETSRKKRRTVLYQFISKFFNPLVLVLTVIGIVSMYFGEEISAFLVFLMILMSATMSFVQEYRSGKEAEKLSEMVHTTATVYRNGKPKEIKIREITPGDIVDLFAGDMIPADLRIISCKDIFVNQATLTGESFPVEKNCAPTQPKNLSVAELTNIAFMGSSVESGTGLGLVIRTGVYTKLGEISRRLTATATETGFDTGIKEFTWLMIRMMVTMVCFIFAINAILKGNVIESFMFSLAVAVGLTPEMLPMIVTINLSKGAIAMSKKQVIVKRLHTIQNFGAMDVLCTDKTGTLTLDKIVLEKHCDVTGKEDEDVLRYAYINSFYQTGLKNLLDKTILKHEKLAVTQYRKIDEMPFDFSRRVMSVVVELNGKRTIITKGAPEEVFKRCTKYELNGEIHEMKELMLSDLREEHNNLSSEGFRVLAVAYGDVSSEKEGYSKEDERELILKGYLAFLDPPKPTVKRTIESLEGLGIEVKVLTGDNEVVTKKIAAEVGLDVVGMATGEQIEVLSDTELQSLVEKTTIFARLSPLQKERIIQALHKNNHIVGFLGDGINDAPALKTSDVGISVDNAVDIAKESADIILLRKSLTVIKDGVIEGRKTFSNIVKYIKMGSSSNFGNMLSMTGAVIFLPFLPMTPIQILLNNFLYDLSQVGIPTDEVDEIYLKEPRPWRVDYIRKFMTIIGPISSIFDFTTFFVMLYVFNSWANPALFHTGWFLESLTTQTLVIHVIRTGKIPFIESSPSKLLALTSILILVIGFGITLSPLGAHFGFVQLPMQYFAILAAIVVVYLLMVQKVKTWFIRKYGYG